MEDGALMTAQEVADMLRLSSRTVRMLVANGKMPAITVTQGARKMGIRFRRSDIEGWLREREVGRR